jgi:hypothetical protein
MRLEVACAVFLLAACGATEPAGSPNAGARPSNGGHAGDGGEDRPDAAPDEPDAGEDRPDAAPDEPDAGAAPFSFDRLLVPGACPADGAAVDLTLALLSGGHALLPDDRAGGATVGEQLAANAFRFAPPADRQTGGDGAVEPEGSDAAPLPVGLAPRDLTFLWTGGREREHDARLVVLLLDQSGSLIGQDANTGAVDTTRASDLDDARLLFFRQLVHGLPDPDYVSLIWFNGSFPTFDPQYAAPTRNRDVITDGLGLLSRGQDGGTPLADALDQTLSRLVEFPDNADLNPVVVLFTDGTEGGDTSPGPRTLDAVIDRYAHHRRTVNDRTVDAPVPVIVVHLQPPASAGLPRGRDPQLARLACATGGEYVFLRDPREFDAGVDPDLAPFVLDRLRGAWRLRVALDPGQATLAPRTGYLLTTEVGVTAAGTRRSATLEAPAQPGDRDTRVWFRLP